MSLYGGLREMSPINSGTLRGYGFVGVGMALLEEVCLCRVALEVSCAQAMPSVDTVYLVLTED